MKLAYRAYFRPLRFLLLYVVACALIFKLVELCESWQTARKFGVPFRVSQQFQQRSMNISAVTGKKQEGQISYRFRPPPMMAASGSIPLIVYSMGAFGAWSWAVHSPSRFAGIVPIAGGGDPRTVSAFVGLPVWAVHGADDDVVSVEKTQAMIDALRQAGGVPKYSEVAGTGHDSWRELFADDSAILRWLFSIAQTISGGFSGSRSRQTLEIQSLAKSATTVIVWAMLSQKRDRTGVHRMSID